MGEQSLFGSAHDCSAEFSPDRIYRYALYRTWDPDKPKVMFVGLNPSTADESKDDPTIRRCKRFAADWGYGGLIMANIFALRATDPKVMRGYVAPIGPENREWLVDLAKESGLIVAAWGNHGGHMNRDQSVMSLLPNMMCLGVTKEGKPRHPLYVRADTLLQKLVYNGGIKRNRYYLPHRKCVQHWMGANLKYGGWLSRSRKLKGCQACMPIYIIMAQTGHSGCQIIA